MDRAHAVPLPKSLSSPPDFFKILTIAAAVIAVLASLVILLALPAIVRYHQSLQRYKEAVLREDLHAMRQALDSYAEDTKKAPQSLDDLVQGGYLKMIPEDPMTNRRDTWMTARSDGMTAGSKTAREIQARGIQDVHSGAHRLAMDGSSYSAW
jgi:general secretion pathway protein G